ncbi:MAG: RNA-binding protein [Candidatus Atribacteria bacterium]|nr:RNA-binding protein [Candidatus Atribacteria bacterium]
MQGSKLYVGNLKYSVTNDELKELFSSYGEVKNVNIIEGKGFGFVEMSSSEEAEKAKEALNNNDYEGRPLKIDEARPPRPRNEYRSRY